MDTVWVLLYGGPGAKLDNNLSKFLYVAVFSSFVALQREVSIQRPPIKTVTWIQHNDRFEGSYYVAEFETMAISRPTKRIVIAVPSKIDYYISEDQSNE